MGEMRAREIVQLMVELAADGGRTLERQRGPSAAEQAWRIQAALMDRLEGNLGHVVLWEQFLETPEAVTPALVSVVRSLLDADPSLAGWLDAALEAYRQAVRSQGMGSEE